MNRLRDHLRNTWRVLLAVVVVALVPAAAEAAGIGFYNGTDQCIYVQGSWQTKAGVKRGPVLLIKPGKTLWDNNLVAGNRTITICDGANRVLLLDAVIFDGMNDQLFNVTPIPMAPKKGPQVKLVSQPTIIP